MSKYRRKRQANSARDGPSTMVDTLARPHVADIEETTTQYGGIGCVKRHPMVV